MKGKQYDYKEAYNKNLTAKARLHYLENARHDQDKSPAKMEDLSGDGKITKKDVLIGRGVLDKDGSPAKQVKGVVDPTTGLPIQPIQPSSLKSPFSPQATDAASGMFGSQIPGSYDSALNKKSCKYKK